MDARKPLPWIDRVETYRGRFAPEAVIPFRELDRVEGYSRTFGQRSGATREQQDAGVSTVWRDLLRSA